jgi:hypothetical protein
MNMAIDEAILISRIKNLVLILFVFIDGILQQFPLDVFKIFIMKLILNLVKKME